MAATDALQSIVMLMASAILWWVLWSAVGGWPGLESRFQQIDPQLADTMLHIGRDEPGVPAPLIIFGWVIVLTAYCIVNHSQSMRLLAARSEWDLKTAALTASVVTVGVMWFNITLGILGRAVMPELAAPDEIYPRLVQEYLTSGLVGLVVAGVLAGGISTYDSIGSSLAAVFTRDVYARFLVKGRNDAHYLRVSRWATPAIIAASFLYIPFLQEGMVRFYLRITSVAVMPLFTMYLMGTLTPVHRRAGVAGLLAGIGYGLSSLLGEALDWPLPLWWTNTWWAYLWSPLVTAGTMLGLSWRWGWMSDRELQGLTFRFRDQETRPTSQSLDPGASGCNPGELVGGVPPGVVLRAQVSLRRPTRGIALVWSTLDLERAVSGADRLPGLGGALVDAPRSGELRQQPW